MTSAPTTVQPMDLKVLVDELEITNGPTTGRLNKHRAALRQYHVTYIDLQLTFRTPASEEPFKRMLRCYEIIEQDDGSFLFDALLAGHRVLCEYDLSTRTGKAKPHPDVIGDLTVAIPDVVPDWLTRDYVVTCVKNREAQNWTPAEGDWYYCEDLERVVQVATLELYYDQDEVSAALVQNNPKDHNGHWGCDTYLPLPAG